MLYKVVLTFETVDEILKCDQSNKSYWTVLSCGAVDNAMLGGSYFWVCRWNPKVWPFKWTLLSSTFLWCCLLHCIAWFLRLSLWMKSWSVTIQMQTIGKYPFVVLLITLYKVVKLKSLWMRSVGHVSMAIQINITEYHPFPSSLINLKVLFGHVFMCTLPTHSLSSMVLLKPTSHFPKHWKLPGTFAHWRSSQMVLFSAHSSTSTRKKSLST